MFDVKAGIYLNVIFRVESGIIANMSRVIGFKTIRLSSTDVSKSKAYYQSLFGVEPVEDLHNFTTFIISGVYLDISAADLKSPNSPGGSVGYWLVDDLNYYIMKAEQLGGKIYRGPLRVKETKTTILQIIDPQGNVVGFEQKFDE